jgi:hypothetical protein
MDVAAGEGEGQVVNRTGKHDEAYKEYAATSSRSRGRSTGRIVEQRPLDVFGGGQVLSRIDHDL